MARAMVSMSAEDRGCDADGGGGGDAPRKRVRQVSASTRTLVHNNYDGWINPFSGRREECGGPLAVPPPLGPQPSPHASPRGTRPKSRTDELAACTPTDCIGPDLLCRKDSRRRLGITTKPREPVQTRFKHLTRDAILHRVTGLLPDLTADVDPSAVINPIKQYPHTSLTNLCRDIDSACASTCAAQGIIPPASPTRNPAAPVTYTSFGDVLTSGLPRSMGTTKTFTPRSVMSELVPMPSAGTAMLVLPAGVESTPMISTLKNLPRGDPPAPAAGGGKRLKKGKKGKPRQKTQASPAKNAHPGTRHGSSGQVVRTPRLHQDALRGHDAGSATGADASTRHAAARMLRLPLAMPSRGHAVGQVHDNTAPHDDACHGYDPDHETVGDTLDTCSTGLALPPSAAPAIDASLTNVTPDSVRDVVSGFLEHTRLQGVVKRPPMPTLCGSRKSLKGGGGEGGVGKAVMDLLTAHREQQKRERMRVERGGAAGDDDDADAFALPAAAGGEGDTNAAGAAELLGHYDDAMGEAGKGAGKDTAISLADVLEKVLSPSARPVYIAPPLTFPNDVGDSRGDASMSPLSPTALRGVKDPKALSWLLQSQMQSSAAAALGDSLGLQATRPVLSACGASTVESRTGTADLPAVGKSVCGTSRGSRRPVATPSTAEALRVRIHTAATSPGGQRQRSLKPVPKPAPQPADRPPAYPTNPDLAHISLDPDANFPDRLDSVFSHFIHEHKSAYESGDGQGLSRELCRYLRRQQLHALSAAAARSGSPIQSWKQGSQKRRGRKNTVHQGGGGQGAQNNTLGGNMGIDGAGRPLSSRRLKLTTTADGGEGLDGGGKLAPVPASPRSGAGTGTGAGNAAGLNNPRVIAKTRMLSLSPSKALLSPVTPDESPGAGVDATPVGGIAGDPPATFAESIHTPTAIPVEKTVSYEDGTASVMLGLGTMSRCVSACGSFASLNQSYDTLPPAGPHSPDARSVVSERLTRFYRTRALEAQTRKLAAGDLDKETGELKRLRNTMKLIQSMKRQQPPEVSGPKIKQLLATVKLPAKLDKYPTIGEFYTMRVTYEGLVGYEHQGLTLDRMKMHGYLFAGKRLDLETFRKCIGRHGARSGQLGFEDVVQAFYPATEVKTIRAWLAKLDFPRHGSVFGTTDDPGPTWISNYSASALEDAFSLFMKIGADPATGLLHIDDFLKYTENGTTVGATRTEFEELCRDEYINLERFAAITVPTYEENAMLF